MSDTPALLLRLRGKSLTLWCIVLPLTLLGVYLLLAQPRYVSESRIVVKQAGQASNAELTLGSLIGSSFSNSTLRDDAMLLQEYLLSPDMLYLVQQQFNLHHAFGNAGVDWFYQLPADASREQLLDYYRHRLSLRFDDKTGMLIVRSEGFTPAAAKHLNQILLKESGRFLNELSHKIAREEMQFARQETDHAYLALGQARERLLRFQNQHRVINPIEQGLAASRMIAEMETRQAQQEAELDNLQRYLQADAPQIEAARHALSALKQQIEKEKAKLSAPSGDRLNRTTAEYTELKGRLDFATDLYKLALNSLEKARVDSGRNIKSLAVIATPSLAEEAEYPQRGWWLISAALVLLLLCGTLKLAIAIIEDHYT
ncbi:hypothetical protein [Aquitalea palustris]|nr:hypothetical protein [Aquitalea palustris]